MLAFDEGVRRKSEVGMPKSEVKVEEVKAERIKAKGKPFVQSNNSAFDTLKCALKELVTNH